LTIKPEIETKICFQNTKVLFLVQNKYNKIPFCQIILKIDKGFITYIVI